MKSVLTYRPVLRFLFLFNLLVALIVPFTVDGAQGIVASVAMGVVALGAGSALLTKKPATGPNE